MKRLRREEETRAYERMLAPNIQLETFSQRFPASPHAHLFRSSVDVAKEEEDEMTYADVNRQLMLIFNVMVSIIACGVCIWLVARHWSTPARLGLSMSGSVIVAIAEVGIYTIYIQRLKEAKQKEKRKVERKQVVESWTIEPNKTDGKEKLIQTKSRDIQEDTVRLRKGKPR
jgi:TMEM199 family protein